MFKIVVTDWIPITDCGVDALRRRRRNLNLTRAKTGSACGGPDAVRPHCSGNGSREQVFSYCRRRSPSSKAHVEVRNIHDQGFCS
jgi:hypothetical protein